MKGEKGDDLHYGIADKLRFGEPQNLSRSDVFSFGAEYYRVGLVNSLPALESIKEQMNEPGIKVAELKGSEIGNNGKMGYEILRILSVAEFLQLRDAVREKISQKVG
jgi:hypothetical protein